MKALSLLGFATSSVSFVVICVLIIGLAFGFRVSTSGEWWVTSIAGAYVGLIMMHIAPKR